jgi:putative transcriptional regulator
VPTIRCALLLLIGLLALPATLFGAAPTDPPRERASLKGQLLIASPAMGDPRFQNTVLVMVRHDASGAMGIVINRPLGERPLSEVLQAFGENAEGVTAKAPIYLGGPVQVELGTVLHSTDYRRSGTLDIDGRVALTASIEIFRDIAAGLGPKQSLIAFGYAGWGPGQLEGEIALTAWFTAPLDLHLVFEEARDKVWERAMEHRTRDL